MWLFFFFSLHISLLTSFFSFLFLLQIWYVMLNAKKTYFSTSFLGKRISCKWSPHLTHLMPKTVFKYNIKLRCAIEHHYGQMKMSDIGWNTAFFPLCFSSFFVIFIFSFVFLLENCRFIGVHISKQNPWINVSIFFFSSSSYQLIQFKLCLSVLFPIIGLFFLYDRNFKYFLCHDVIVRFISLSIFLLNYDLFIFLLCLLY